MVIWPLQKWDKVLFINLYKFISYDLHFFDSENREIKIESWHAAMGFEDSTIYRYDENSNLIYELNVDNDGKTVWETYCSYNSESMLMSEIYIENNTLKERVYYI